MGQKVLVTGGMQREHAGRLHEAHLYRMAVLLEVDIDTGQTRQLLQWETPTALRPDDLPSLIFKAATLRDGLLYLCTLTEVLVYSWPDLEQVRHVSLPVFNDLHHVLPVGELLYVVTTGLDGVAVVGPDDSLVEVIPALDEDLWARFDRGTDYRKIATTKPHSSHPNYAFELDGQVWLTRLKQQDAVCLSDRSLTMAVADAPIHDGVVAEGQVRFTTVDGRLIFVDGTEHQVVRTLDLYPITPGDTPLGWCRGLHVQDGTALVGFSRIRPTRIQKNVQWLKKRFGRKAGSLPTRIGVYDVHNERHVRDIDLEPAGLSAVFSDPADVSPKAQRGSVVWLALTRGVLVVSGVAVQLVLARWLGDAGYGIYGFLLSVTMLFGFVAHLNLQLLLARDVARAPDRAAAALGEGLVAVTLATVPAVGLVVVYTVLFDGRPDVVWLSLPAALAMLASAAMMVVQGVLQGLRRMRSFPVANLVGRAVLVAGIVGVLLAGMGVGEVFVVTAGSTVLTTVILLGSFARGVGLPRLPRPRAVLDLVRASLPFSLNRLYGSVYLSSDVLIVAAFHPDEEVGLYRVASLLLVNLAVLSGIFVDAIYPGMARAKGAPEELGDQLSFGLRLLLLPGIAIAVGGICVAPDLVELALGERYLAAVPAMIVLLPILPVRYANHLGGTALSAIDRQPVRTRSTLYAAVLNVGANLLVVPLLGALGAALTTLLTEVLLCAYLWWRVSPDVSGLRIVSPLLRILLAAGVMSAVVVGLDLLPVAVPVFARIAAGGLVFGGASYALGTWSLSDLRRVRRI